MKLLPWCLPINERVCFSVVQEQTVPRGLCIPEGRFQLSITGTKINEEYLGLKPMRLSLFMEQYLAPRPIPSSVARAPVFSVRANSLETLRRH